MILSEAEQNLFLDCRYGASKAAIASTSDNLHLFAGDPRVDGVELTTGYTPPTISNDGTNWPAADLGQKVGAVQTITSTAAFADEATHWALKNTTTGEWGPAGPLPEAVSVTAAGVVILVTPFLYFSTAV